MIPNKKTLNPKNQSPWILCPSKSFPGKFYYFNGSTGETAWCLSENEKIIRKATIPKVTDKTHTYPEPFGPPIDDSTNTSNSYTSFKNVGSTEFGNNVTKDYNPRYHIPSFGQAVFPKYVAPEVLTPKVIWTLTPMYVPNQSQPHRQIFDQTPQTYERDQPMFIQTSSVPSNYLQTNNRINYPDVFKFSKNPSTPPFDKDRPIFGQAFQSKEVQTFDSKRQTKDEACQTFEPIIPTTQTGSDSTEKSALKPGRSVEHVASLFTKDVETSTLSSQHKVDSAASKLSELAENDLRFLLVARKKKMELRQNLKEVEDLPKQHENVTRKRVTFDLQGDTSPEDTQDIDQHLDSSIEEANELVPSGGLWYVVADLEALLSDWQSIEDYVKRDSNCRLLIPLCVRAALSQRARGGDAAAARQLLRTLAARGPHVVLQSVTESEHASTEDNILQCCWDVMQENTRVILITNNTKMLTKAKTIYLECHTIRQIKNGYRHVPLPQVDIKKVKIVINNDRTKSENLFLQDVNEMQLPSFTKINGFPLHDSRINLTSVENNAHQGFCEKDNDSDKLINLTRKSNTALSNEMTGIKDQITKLRIAENSNFQSRTKLIMKNVFWNTGRDDHHTENANVHEKENYKHTNNNHNSKDKDRKYVPSDIDIDEIDQDISRPNFTERNVEKNRDKIKVSGITKLNSHFNLDEELETFAVKNAIVENRVKTRLDEWICRLNQIMENALTDVLLKENVEFRGMPAPWYMYEAIQVTGERFKHKDNIQIIIDAFSMMLLNCSTGDGKLKKDMTPRNYLKLVGFSKILLQKMKDIIHYDELYEAEDMINDLFKNIEDPNTDIVLSLDNLNTPILQKSEVLEPKVEFPYRKSRTEIIDYLKRHFEQWNKPENQAINVSIEKNIVCDKESNIVRTCGKHLNMLKINNSKSLSVDKESHVNNKTNKVDVTKEPKVIRNVTIIEAFEEKLRKPQLDLDNVDDESLYSLLSEDDYDDTYNNEFKKEDVLIKTKDLIEYHSILDDLSVSASSVDTECIRAYPLVKIFLVRLKRTLILIYNFINECMREYQDALPIDRKEDIRLKIQITHQYVLKFTERLKRIMARESGDGNTLRDLLIKAGDYVEGDVLVVNYKEIIAKYMEQAQILEDALAIMLSLANGSSKDRDTGYCDTFNTTSPILPTRTLRSNKVAQLTNGG